MTQALLDSVQSRGGIVRQSHLTRFSKRAIAEAVQAGHLRRIRRSWLALPDADPLLQFAAQSGVALSCVTVAKRRGLWAFESDAPHVAAPQHSGGVQIAQCVVHWHDPVVPRTPHALEDSLENALVLISLCRAREDALVAWESALNKGLIDRVAISRLRLPARARELLECASPYSDSGLETIVRERLRWLRVRIIPQAWIDSHRVDFLLGERLVLQIDGGHHVGTQREEDNRHDAQLLIHGYHVVRVGYRQVVEDWPSVQDVIMRAVAQGLHLAEGSVLR